MLPRRLRRSVAALALAAFALPADAATVRILMEDLEIKPAEVSAKVGDTIEWTNKDVVAHTATAGNGDFDVTLPAGESASVVVKNAARIDYYCRFHPNMTGKLDVRP